jgi:putative transposase
MPNYRRYRVGGGCYFFTVNLLERAPNDLLARHIDVLRNAVAKVQRARPFHVDAWVVLPDHLHCVWTLPPGDDDFSTRWRLIKTYFAREMPPTERRSRVRRSRGERGLWQRRYWEHLIRNDNDFHRHVEYCYINPVKHGYVSRACDWPYSSFHRDVREGLFPVDWAGDSAFDLAAGERESGRVDWQ